MPDPRSDADLIAAAASGDAAAFESLYLRHRDWAAALAYRFTGDRDAALDTVQETFIYLLRKIPTLRLTARLTTFLYPVIKHTAQAARRKRRIAPAPPAGDDDGGDLWLAAAPSPTGLPADDSAALHTAVAGLSSAHRETLLMRYAAEMSLEEIAAALNIPLGTVKSRLHLAIRSLQHRMQPPDRPVPP